MIKIHNTTLSDRNSGELYKTALAIYYHDKNDRESLLEFLSNFEVDFAKKIDNDSIRKNFVGGRYAAKMALMSLTGIKNPKSFSIKNGTYGQPIVESNFADLQISISHSTNYCGAVAFFAKCPIGLDIEEINDIREKSATSQMTTKEITEINTKPEIKYPLLVLWTAKESLSKILKTGLSIDFSALEAKNFKYKDSIVDGEFCNFGQYKFQSYVRDDFILTMSFLTRVSGFKICHLF